MADPTFEAARAAAATEHNIPEKYHLLLTETDPEKLQAQAAKVGALVADIPPLFAHNPGQGQSIASQPSEDAEYLLYHPKTNRQ